MPSVRLGSVVGLCNASSLPTKRFRGKPQTVHFTAGRTHRNHLAPPARQQPSLHMDTHPFQSALY